MSDREWPDYITRRPPRSKEEMKAAMKDCEQSPGLSVYQHGEAVWEHLCLLTDHLKGGSPLVESRWRLPKWFQDYGHRLADKLHHEGRMQSYTLYHDCGKPYCRHTDKKTGRSHFPDHELASSYIWACVGGNDYVRHLIGNDMVIHVASADEIATKVRGEWSCEDSASLLLTALAEVHANGKMFGGLDAVSFKMKCSTVDRRGKQICKMLFPDEPPESAG